MPESGRRRPWMHSTVVVLPAPLAPIKPTISPGPDVEVEVVDHASVVVGLAEPSDGDDG
ncbi:MAG: hypothetical protein ACR2LK_08490 [Solirubrobacteraceae bacterium]